MSTNEKFSHVYKKCSIHLFNRCGISQSTPLEDPAFSLAYCLMSGFDTICNNSNLQLGDIVNFGLSSIAISLTILKRLIERGFHTRNVSIFNWLGISQWSGKSDSKDKMTKKYLKDLKVNIHPNKIHISFRWLNHKNSKIKWVLFRACLCEKYFNRQVSENKIY